MKNLNQGGNLDAHLNNLKTMQENTRKLAVRLWAGIIIVFVVLIIGISALYYEKLALALSANYGKVSGEVIDASTWNTIGADFVAKSGDTMTGGLTTQGLTVNGKITFSGGTGPFCIFASTCPTGWISKGRGGYIRETISGGSCPYEAGTALSSAVNWQWCHPNICCNQ